MLEITATGKIILTKGDNAELDIRLFNQDGAEEEIKPTDVLTLTICDIPAVHRYNFTNDAECVNSIFLSPADTADLDVGMYNYQVDLERDNEIQTVIPKNILELREELR